MTKASNNKTNKSVKSISLKEEDLTKLKDEISLEIKNNLKEELKEEIKTDVIKTVEKDLKEELKEEITKTLKEDIDEVVKTEVHEQAHTILNNAFDKDMKDRFFDNVDSEIQKRVISQERAVVRMKNWSIFKRNILIIILLGLSLFFGYNYVKDNYFITDKEENQNTEIIDNNQKEDEIIKDDAYYLKNFSYLLKYVKVDYTNNMNYYLYTKDMVSTEIRNDVKLNMVYNNLEASDIVIENDKKKITNLKFKTAYEKIFNDNLYKPVSFVVGCNYFVYDSLNEVYEGTNLICDTPTMETMEEIIKIEEDEKTGDIYVNTVVGIYDRVGRALYKYDDWFNPIVEYTEKETINVKELKDELNSYKYTFKKDKDNKYYFSSISLNK